MAERVAQRIGREGSRWINRRPTAPEVAEWFQSVPLHEGMNHDDFIGGVVLIQGKEKARDITGHRDDGSPIVAEREHVTFTPYVRVDTRVSYFWKLMELHADEWVGSIEPVPLEGLREAQALALPPGFFRFVGSGPDGKAVTFVGSCMRARIYRKGTITYQDVSQGLIGEPVTRRVKEGDVVFDPPPATKIVPVATRYDVDPFSMMKAETGAVGRALGMAGILVVGTGVATAEDMHELGGGAGESEIAATLPDQPAPALGVMPELEQLRARADELIAAIGELDSDRGTDLLTQVNDWAHQRRYVLAELGVPELKIVIKKLEKTYDEAGGRGS